MGLDLWWLGGCTLRDGTEGVRLDKRGGGALLGGGVLTVAQERVSHSGTHSLWR